MAVAYDYARSVRRICRILFFGNRPGEMTPDTVAGKLRILYVAYPLLPLSEHSAGGAEQVLWTLEREMQNRGHSTTVAACNGSQVAGKLLPTGDPAERPDQFEERSHEQNHVLLDRLSSGSAQVDLIHDMSGDFWKHAHDLQIPILVTLHLP